MVADIRAKISCNLGEVISGNWSDEALAVGQGLIRCRGQVILRGIVVPTAGTIVKLAYVRDGQLAKVPRVLRVLSSFADPLRQTTTVQLGDKLVWLEQKRQGPVLGTIAYPPDPQPGDPLETPLPYPAPELGTGVKIERRIYNGICWKKEIISADDEFAFDWNTPNMSPWEQNPDRPADEALKAPVTISARAIMAKCLAGLALTSTGIPLLSQYEENAVDLKNGYVAAMEQLLSAESYVGYLDEQERLVINPTKPEEVTSGPVIREVDIIDIGPIGSGELPMDDPVVEFDEPQPKEPPKQPEPVAPVAVNFIGGSSYNGSVVTVPAIFFTGRSWFDSTRLQLGGIKALYSVSGGTGGNVEQTQQGAIFTPEQGFNGTATFTYQVTDGYQLSNSATVYIRVSSVAPTPEDLDRDLAEAPSEDPAPPEPPPNLAGESWSFDDGSNETLTIQYTTQSGTKGVAEYSYTPSSTTREVLNSRGNVYYREERQKTGRASALGNALQRYLEQGIEPDVNGTVTTVTITQSDYRTIDKPGDNNSPKEKPPLSRGACQINGECPSDLAFPENPAAGAIHRYGECDYRYNGIYWEVATGTIFDPDTSQNPRFSLKEALDRGLVGSTEEEKVRDVVTTYEPGEVAIGALNWPEGIRPPLTASEYIGERVITDYYRDRTRGITRTVTTRYIAAYKLPEGQQQLAAQGDTYANFGSLREWLSSATRLMFAGQSSSTRYDVNYGLTPGASVSPEKPTPRDPNLPDEPSTEPPSPSKGSTGNDPGPPDLSLPLTPAAPKTWDPENGYQEQWEKYQRHNARVMARRYARAQRAIAYGNRYGMSLQVVPWSVPRYPLEPLYLDLAGVVGAYRTNGITVAFDSNGVVANVDALLVGGVGGTGTPYYPVPSTVTTLPLAPSSTLNPGVVPWSSIPVPPDFDPANPGGALDTIPSLDVVEYPETLAPDFIIPPAATTVTAVRGVRVGLRCKRLDYAVVPLEREVSLGVVVGIEASAVTTGVFRVFSVDAALLKGSQIAVETGAITVAGNDAALVKA